MPMPEPDVIFDAAIAVLARDGWAQLRFAAIAEAAGTDLGAVRAVLPHRAAILFGIFRRADAAVLSGPPPALQEPARDRLFDVLMRHFDALQPMKPALRAIARGTLDPLPGLMGLLSLPQSMRWMMEAAGLSPAGLGGTLQLHGLCLLYAAVFQTWLRDDGRDLDRTMRALDQALRRAEPLAAWLEHRGPAAATAAEQREVTGNGR